MTAALRIVPDQAVRLRGERDQARRIAVTLEQEIAEWRTVATALVIELAESGNGDLLAVSHAGQRILTLLAGEA